MMPRLLTTRDVATALGVSTRWVEREIKDGHLPALVIRLGRRPTYRVDETDLRDLIAQASTRGQPEP